VAWLLMLDGLSFSELYWDFHAQPSLGFAENGLKKNPEERREWSNWFELIKRQQ